MMNEVIANIQAEQAILLTAPPGWGKTYKLLRAIKETKRKALFLFPLRALCDEVFVQAIRQNIDTCNIRATKDFSHLSEVKFQLIVSTPECVSEEVFEKVSEEYVIIVDESHLFELWGETFRPKLIDIYHYLQTYAPPTIFLSATMSEDSIVYFQKKLDLFYKDIQQIDMGNLRLKNLPKRIFCYFPGRKKWILRDLIACYQGSKSLVFCKYRSEVKSLEKSLNDIGIKCLSCVGGEAQQFVAQINSGITPEVIISTSVLGHGVNLPEINKVYFLYKVDRLEYYLQMLGRGGREGGGFELHTMNKEYFELSQRVRGLIWSFLKSIRNRMKFYLYWKHGY